MKVVALKNINPITAYNLFYSCCAWHGFPKGFCHLKCYKATENSFLTFAALHRMQMTEFVAQVSVMVIKLVPFANYFRKHRFAYGVKDFLPFFPLFLPTLS